MAKIKIRKVKPIIAYASSLIQQNHGETLTGHGWCDWDVATRSFEFYELPTNYGYYTLRIENGVVPNYDDMPDNVRLRIFAGNLPETEIKKLVASIRRTHNILELSVTHFSGAKLSAAPMALGQMLDVHDVQFQNKLIADYLKLEKPEVSPDVVRKVLDLNGEVNSNIKTDELARKLLWQPISLKFDNLFTYGEGNSIDFTSLTGITGIFAPNSSGKTSLAEAICFALYDRTPRTIRAANIMNTRKDSCYLEFKFEVEGVQYTVERKGTRSKKGEVKIDVDFWKLENGVKVSLNGEERRYTDKNIAKIVGEYEDFMLTTFSSSAQTGLFVDRGQSDRKDLLSQFLGLNIFDKLHTTANEESKSIQGALKQFKNVDFTQELADATSKMYHADSDVDLLKRDLEQVSADMEQVELSIQEQFAKKTPVGLSNTDVTALRNQLIVTEKNITDAEGVVESSTAELTTVRSNLAKARTKLETEYGTFEQDHAAFTARIHAYDMSVRTYESDKKELERIARELERLRQYAYDPNCTFCLTNGKNTIDLLQVLERTHVELQSSVTGQETALAKENENLWTLREEFAEKNKKHKIGLDFVKKCEQQERQLTALIDKERLSAEKYRTAIKTIEHDIAECERLATAIAQNAEIDLKINALRTTKAVRKAEINKLLNEIDAKRGDYIHWERVKRDLEARIVSARELEEQYEVYSAYLAAVCRDGVPYKMLADILPELQMAVNKILNQMVEFSLIFDMDGKNVNIRLSYDEERVWPLELAAGMEKFISGLAIRVALTSLSSLPKSHFLIVDEGLGSLDADNLSSISMLFDILRTHFKFILLISHIDETRDIADRLVDIERTNGQSRIQIS